MTASLMKCPPTVQCSSFPDSVHRLTPAMFIIPQPGSKELSYTANHSKIGTIPHNNDVPPSASQTGPNPPPTPYNQGGLEGTVLHKYPPHPPHFISILPLSAAVSGDHLEIKGQIKGSFPAGREKGLIRQFQSRIKTLISPRYSDRHKRTLKMHQATNIMGTGANRVLSC